ncbi:MAG: Peroxide-responsive repressor PerR [Syntrophorhabdus sp. PtaU1.Bin153]|nr:MAG: Peroxide-responsive repressor PerR [Syntrophorhabdus sp. PtaU1.Bin153]
MIIKMERITVVELQQMGLKVTPQREALLKLLNGNETHPSAEDLYHKLLRRFPRISFATVYNTLSKLAEAGKIQELDIDPQRKRFDPFTAPHHHFYCKVCRRVFNVGDDVSPSGAENLLNATDVNGHRVDTVHVNLRGVCKDCKDSDEAGKWQQ